MGWIQLISWLFKRNLNRIQMNIVTWTKMYAAKPNDIQTKTWCFSFNCSINSTNFSLHPICVASWIVQTFMLFIFTKAANLLFGQQNIGNGFLYPRIGSQSCGWLTPQHSNYNFSRILNKVWTIATFIVYYHAFNWLHMLETLWINEKLILWCIKFTVL